MEQNVLIHVSVVVIAAFFVWFWRRTAKKYHADFSESKRPYREIADKVRENTDPKYTQEEIISAITDITEEAAKKGEYECKILESFAFDSKSFSVFKLMRNIEKETKELLLKEYGIFVLFRYEPGEDVWAMTLEW